MFFCLQMSFKVICSREKGKACTGAVLVFLHVSGQQGMMLKLENNAKRISVLV